MWDDLPQRTSVSKKILMALMILLIVAGLVYIGYLLFWQNQGETTTKSSPSPLSSTKISGTPSISPSLSASPIISPSPSGTPDYKIPTGETFVMASTNDTNGDGKEENLVITKMSSDKYHVYILSSDGQVLFDNKELAKKPVRISTQTFDPTTETFLSWVLIFTENSGDMSLIHWNGTKYEIPQAEGI